MQKINDLPGVVNPEHQQKKPKNIIIFSRHGERADRREPDNCQNFYDTNLTVKGFKESIQTGKNLGEKFQMTGLIPIIKKLKLIVSPFYRCIQTAKYLRHGLAVYLKDAGFEEESEFVQKMPFHLEDAFMERITKRPVEHVHEMFIYKDKKFLEERFPEIEFIKNTLFDYEKNGKQLHAEYEIWKREDLFNCCFSAYINLFDKVMKEKGDSFYLSVSHGMYVELLSMFTNDKTSYKKIHYNSTSMLQLKDFKVSEDEDGNVSWDSEHVYFFKMRKRAEGKFKLSKE